MRKMFSEQSKLIQICENCVTQTRALEMTLPSDQARICDSCCQQCLDLKDVCINCKEKGYVSYIPSVRACKVCVDSKIKCVRRVIVALAVDCEEGNKQCLLVFKAEIEEGTIDPELTLLSVLPDCPHVVKNCKESFANWLLQLSNER